MDLEKESFQRKKFIDLLFELSKSDKWHQDAYSRSSMYKNLEAIYAPNEDGTHFRHFYSDIFLVLSEVQKNTQLGNTDVLIRNIDTIRSGYHPQNYDSKGNLIDISDSINKLYDHVNLDVARLSVSDAGDEKYSGKSAFDELQNQIRSLKEIAHSSNEEVKKVKEKLNNSQKEYISILGIFSSVVLAFTGGIAFSTSVLNNIANSSVYRIIAVSLIIGLVLSNIIFCLFYYIGNMVDKKLNTTPIIILDIILIVLFAITVYAWYTGVVEVRDKSIETSLLVSLKGLI